MSTTDELFQRQCDKVNRELDTFKECQTIHRGDGGNPPELVYDPANKRFDIWQPPDDMPIRCGTPGDAGAFDPERCYFYGRVWGDA